MDISKFSPTGRAILLLIGQILVVIACLGYIEYTYLTEIVPDQVVSETYEIADCQVTDKSITMRSGIVNRYRADFQINYIASNGQEYNAWVSGNGLDTSFTNDRDSQEEMLQEFSVGETYPCWYNPESPELVVLMLRHSWSSTFSLFIPSIILLIVIYYLTRNAFFLTNEFMQKRRNKK